MRVCVVGAGHIGLPTACILAEKGIEVIATDIDQDIVDNINQGKTTIEEPGLQELLETVHSSGKLSASTDVTGSVRESQAAIIIVPTPLTSEGPDMKFIEAATQSVADGLKKGTLVILESTVYPGTTEKIIRPLLEKSGLKADTDFYLAYSPERAIPTRTIEEIKNNPRVVGAIGKNSGKKAEEFYSSFIDGEISIVESPTIAEFVKLAENIFRDVNIALANELAMVSEKLGIDIQEVIKYANKHPRVELHKPGAGVGGHCIPKDPYFLINKAKDLGIETRLVSTARQINESMPAKVVSLVEEGLTQIDKKLPDSRVAVLGFAYKGDTGDFRITPAETIITSLRDKGAEVHIHDPFVKSNNGFTIETDLGAVLDGSDCVVVVTDHSEYRNLNIGELSKELRQPALVVDGRNILDRSDIEASGLTYKGIGK